MLFETLFKKFKRSAGTCCARIIRFVTSDHEIMVARVHRYLIGAAIVAALTTVQWPTWVEAILSAMSAVAVIDFLLHAMAGAWRAYVRSTTCAERLLTKLEAFNTRTNMQIDRCQSRSRSAIKRLIDRLENL